MHYSYLNFFKNQKNGLLLAAILRAYLLRRQEILFREGRHPQVKGKEGANNNKGAKVF
jgi:hypothetical protein